jgi:hypothetical protein
MRLQKEFQRSLAELLRSDAWKSLSAMRAITNWFNLFSLLEDAVCENSWSRIIHFLFDSSADHGLGLIPIRQWIRTVHDRELCRLVNSAKATVSETEWGTFEGRRLDILIRLLDTRGHLLGVMKLKLPVMTVCPASAKRSGPSQRQSTNTCPCSSS